MTATGVASGKANVALLAISQALLLTTIVGGMAISGLAGHHLAANPALATVPVAALVLGPFLVSFPASLFMARFGRRAGFMVGTGLAVAGGSLAAVAVYLDDFWLFVAGHLLIGAYQGFGNYYRFAAMEAAPEHLREKAMSWVIAAGVVAAFAGPALAHAARPLGPTEFLGSYAAMGLLGLVSLAIISRLRLPSPPAPTGAAEARPLWQAVSNYRVLVAVLTAATGYAVMILAMTATPLAMVHAGHAMEHSRTVIQWHVVGMFAPSFFTGRLIQTVGAARVALAGLGLLGLHVGIAVAGLDMLHFISALVFLGVGWNFTFVAGTAMLTQAHSPAERAKVQAFNEFTVFGLAAAASLSAGWLLAHVGWVGLNYLLLPPLLLTALLLLPSLRTETAALFR